MKRRSSDLRSAALGFMAAIPSLAGCGFLAGTFTAKAENDTRKESSEKDKLQDKPADRPSPLVAPAKGTIPVAFVISDGAVVIDFAGPWEVFQDVMIDQRMPFHLYTVAASTKTIHRSEE